MISKRAGDGTQNDIVLFTRFLEGDDRAFTQFLDRHNPRLYAYSLKMLGDEQAAEDLMQEVWEKVIRMRTNPPRADNPVGLLMRMVRNLSLNYLRDNRRHATLEEIPGAQIPSVTPGEPSYLEELIVMALDRLPMPQREVIILHVYSGYDYTEIARMMEIPVDNVRMRAMRGRTHLARIMAALASVEDERLRSIENRESSLRGSQT
jgi:RNA polymerase sigma-70 factor, ECF subfamily